MEGLTDKIRIRSGVGEAVETKSVVEGDHQQVSLGGQRKAVVGHLRGAAEEEGAGVYEDNDRFLPLVAFRILLFWW